MTCTGQVEHNEDIQSVLSKNFQFLPDVICVQSLVDLVDLTLFSAGYPGEEGLELAGHPGRKVKRPFCNDICQYR